MPFPQAQLTKALFAAVAASLCLFSVSCGTLTQPAPDRALFAINPGEPLVSVASTASTTQPSTRMSASTVLEIQRLRVASPYDAQPFVYRMKGDEFRTDYYNGFIAAPDQLLTGSLIQWESRTGPFSSVVDAASGIPARYVLSGNITALYGDYADKAAPKATITLRIFLLDDADANSRIIFQKTYTAAAPIELGSAESLVKGFNSAYREILQQLTTDLRKRFAFTQSAGS